MALQFGAGARNASLENGYDATHCITVPKFRARFLGTSLPLFVSGLLVIVAASSPGSQNQNLRLRFALRHELKGCSVFAKRFPRCGGRVGVDLGALVIVSCLSG